MTGVAKFRPADADPDPAIVEELELALALAKEGKLRTVVLAGGLSGGNVYTTWVSKDAIPLLGHLAILQNKLVHALPVVDRRD